MLLLGLLHYQSVLLRNSRLVLRPRKYRFVVRRYFENLINSCINPHRLRHSYAGNLLKKGVDIRYIKDAMRHSSISSTQIYTQLDKEELKEKLQEFI